MDNWQLQLETAPPDVQRQLIAYNKELQRRKDRWDRWASSYCPNATQRKFHYAMAAVRILYGGNRSGKTHALAWEVAMRALNWNPYRNYAEPARLIWLGGATKESHGEVWGQKLLGDPKSGLPGMLPPWSTDNEKGVVWWSLQDRIPKSITVTNVDGGRCIIGCKTYEMHVQSWEGRRVNMIACDEMPPLFVITASLARIIDHADDQVAIAVTPLERSIPAYFVDWIRRAKDKRKRAVIQKFLIPEHENDIHIDARKRKALFDLMPADIRRNRMGGTVAMYSKMFYPELTEAHFCPPIRAVDIPKDWVVRDAGIDPGYKTAAGLFLAWKPDGDLVMFAEYCAHGQTDPEINRDIIEFRGRYGLRYTYFDPEILGTSRATGRQRLEFYDDAMIAENRTTAADSICLEWLRIRPETGTPRLTICSNLTNFIQDLRFAERDVFGKLENTKAHHFLAAFRYVALSSMPPDGQTKVEEKEEPMTYKRYRQQMDKLNAARDVEEYRGQLV